ncbi:MAG: diacylglycerol kinase [Thermoguttaceae bacterium]|jgi:diacylglycerol kinase
MNDQSHFGKRSWVQKFRDAFRGLGLGVYRQSSFRVHFFFTFAVVLCGAIFHVSLLEWCVLLVCIMVVLAAEMFNSALESMGKAITDEHHAHLGNALDIGSAAVLIASLGSALVGTLIFVNRLGLTLGWW